MRPHHRWQHVNTLYVPLPVTQKMRRSRHLRPMTWSGVRALLRTAAIYLLILNIAVSAVIGSTDPPPIFSYGDSTPFPDAIKCYTCEGKADNDECNSKAYDAFCPQGTKYCYTRHHLNHSSGDSYQVTKKCAIHEICAPHLVGCAFAEDNGQKVCVSCCEGSLCNVGVPVNESTATFTTITPYNGSPMLQHHSAGYILTLLALLTVAYVFRIS